MQKRYFISYSRKDSELVDEFIKTSENFKFSTWIDKRDQEYGKKWREGLETAIKESDGAILFVSLNALESKAIVDFELPIFLNQKDIRKENFDLFIVILDYVPEELIESFKTKSGEYVFRDRHIKNVGANRIDSEEKLPSELLPGARQKYWYKLCDEISNDVNSNSLTDKLKNPAFKKLIKYSFYSILLSLVLVFTQKSFSSAYSMLQSFNTAIQEIISNQNDNEVVSSNTRLDPPVIIQNQDSESQNTFESSEITEENNIQQTTTTTSSTSTTVVNVIESSQVIQLNEKYKLNLPFQDYTFLDDLFLKWVNQARVYSITQYEEGVVISFTPLYDLNAYKIYLNDINIGSINYLDSWYMQYNNIVLKNLVDGQNYKLEVYLVDRYYREFGPIYFDFQYVWNNDDAFPYNNLNYTNFDGVLFGDLPNNPGGNGFEKPILKNNLGELEVTTFAEIYNNNPEIQYRYRVNINNLVYERFTHYLVTFQNEIIGLSNVLDFFVPSESFDNYIKIIPFNGILNYGDSFELFIAESMFTK